ncbi:pyridoxal-phosphate-dependent aminotransferase family protein [Thermogemmatispora carboxidivorans]|uniref:pyridoxal-phosphate-dependent aminotransferase family protein n=1 Tax=Thermogemmatispora carboxidivorans TaxID=1382306 RepID=UPI00069B2F64|nr:alanine--glyoxylate aminotransferase family protein [Thermogemmatispora carboxidivorans]
MTPPLPGQTSLIQRTISELHPPYRLLLGPGPCNVDPRVLLAASAPQLGHLDPFLLDTLGAIADQLRQVFQTQNELTLCVSGSGFAGAEAVLCNLLEEGDTLIAGSLGFFSGKIAEIAQRIGAQVILLESEPGQPLDPQQVVAAFARHPKAKLFATAIAETSTGLLQPLEELERIAHAHGALFVVDAVSGLGGIPINVEQMKIDACYAGSQKCLGALPGLAPVTLNARAVEAIKRRRRPIQSYYLDLLALQRYWNGDHAYHHTACSNLLFAMHEALRIVLEEGLEARWQRHHLHGEALRAGLQALGLTLLPRPSYELPVLTAVRLPSSVSESLLRQQLLTGYSIEVGGGLGSLKGQLLRIGLMGYNACRKNVETVLAALEQLLPSYGWPVQAGTALTAAAAVYSKEERPSGDA